MRPYMALANLRRRCGWRRALALTAAALLVAAALAAPERARRYVQQTLAKAGGGSAEVAAVGFDPLRLEFRLHGVRLTDPNGVLLLAVDGIVADLAADSLWTRSVHLDALSVSGVRGQVGLRKDGSFSPRPPPADPDGGPPPRIRIDRLTLAGSAVALRDASAQPAAALSLTDLTVSLTGFDSQAKAPAQLTLQGRMGRGVLRMEGEFAPAPFSLTGKFALQGLAAGPALAYLERAMSLRARGGQIDATGTLSLSAAGGLQLQGGHVVVRGAQVSDARDTPLAQVVELTVDGLGLDLNARRLTVGQITGRDNWVALSRGADGRLNLDDLTGDRSGTETANPTWQVTLGPLELTGQHLTVSDATVQPALRQEITVDQLNIGALGVADKVPVTLTASLPDGASLAVRGEAVLPTGPADLEIIVKGLPLPPLARYLPDVGPMQLRSGTAAASGHLSLGETGPEYRGTVTLSRVELWDTERDEALLGLRTLRVDEVVASKQGLTSRKIWINRPVLRAIITENRQSNLSRFGPRSVAPVATAPVASAGPGPAPMRLKVDTVRVSRGTLHVEDHSLTPHFAVSIQQLRGDVDGLSSDTRERARVSLTGRIDDYAPASVKGNFTLAVPRQAAFHLTFTGVEMATFAPYVGKFAGYRVERGTLNVDLDYTVESLRVIGKNGIVLDRLVLGERVDSPDALDLPLTLALAVLKNSAGVIEVDLPVRGDLSNPQFDYGALVGRAIMRAIVKAATAPFTLLARLVGGKSKDLQTVTFAPGSADLPAVQSDKLQKLAQALIKRPQLVLDIRPRVDQDDSRALASRALSTALGDGPDGDGVNDSDDEDGSSERLSALYRERFGTEPPPVPPPEGTHPSTQEQRAAAARAGRERLLAALAPDATALLALAQARGEAIRAALMDNGVSVQRLAITLPAESTTLPVTAHTEFALGTS